MSLTRLMKKMDLRMTLLFRLTGTYCGLLLHVETMNHTPHTLELLLFLVYAPINVTPHLGQR